MIQIPLEVRNSPSNIVEMKHKNSRLPFSRIHQRSSKLSADTNQTDPLPNISQRQTDECKNKHKADKVMITIVEFDSKCDDFYDRKLSMEQQKKV